MSTASRLIATILIAIAGVTDQPTDTTEPTPIEINFSQSPVISEQPSRPLTVIGAAEKDHTRLEAAIELFADEGLQLPPLIVRFSEDRMVCNTNAGIYRRARWSNDLSTDYIAICSTVRVDLVHELAHAWEQNNLSDQIRSQFMEHWGLEHWLSRDVDWHQRAGEKAANTIAFGLIVDYETNNGDLLQFTCGYSMLTGTKAPHDNLYDCTGFEA